MKEQISLPKRLWNILTASYTVENIPDAVLIVDKNGNLTGANKAACRCFGIKNSEIENKRIDDFIENALEYVKASVQSKRPVVVEASKKNSEFFAELNAVEKRSIYIVTIRDLTNLTNQRQIEEKVARFNGEKNAMLVKLEGELKGPATSILGFSQSLLDGIGGKLTEK